MSDWGNTVNNYTGRNQDYTGKPPIIFPLNRSSHLFSKHLHKDLFAGELFTETPVVKFLQTAET